MIKHIGLLLLCIPLIYSCSQSNDDGSRLEIYFKQKSHLDYRDVLAGVAINPGPWDKYNPEKISSFPKSYKIEKTFRVPF